ncbi:MAG: hypothetical protein IKZ08_02700 [Bacteroidales bacterium]|nr:hypothetical protein [Bacteroidales bacterium]
MPNWLTSMQRTYEYYVVDPKTWHDVKQLRTVTKCSIERDSSAETLGSASVDMSELVGEAYIRVYLITIQHGIRERHALGTFLVQTPTASFDGKVQDVSVDAYTPLLELKENPPPLGYSVMKGANIMDSVYRNVREHVRAPVVKPSCDTTLFDDFVANTDDNWLSFNADMMVNAKHEFDLDEMGRILFAPVQDIASLQPVWTYTDDNSSILLAEVDVKHDLYGIPNVVEVIYSSAKDYYYARVVNDDPNSPTSTVNRGREIIHRVTDPSIIGNPTENQIQEYAERLLRELSSVEYTITYKHGYCPVRLGDCVRLDYRRAGLTNLKGKVIRQSIDCTPECQVTETVVCNMKLWR